MGHKINCNSLVFTMVLICQRFFCCIDLTGSWRLYEVRYDNLVTMVANSPMPIKMENGTGTIYVSNRLDSVSSIFSYNVVDSIILISNHHTNNSILKNGNYKFAIQDKETSCELQLRNLSTGIIYVLRRRTSK